MITAGIDVGLRNTKIALLKDGRVVGKGEGISGGGKRAGNIETIWKEALSGAGIEASDISRVVATGQGKEDVAFADDIAVETVADARAARFFYPEAGAVVDAGADQTRVVTLGEGNGVEEVVFNQKCMAGLGLLLEIIADRLDLTIEEIASIPEGASGGASVNDGCPVFAEEGVLELLNDGVSAERIAGAATDVAVVRLNSILNDKIVPKKDNTVLIGGLARNAAFVAGLKKRSGIAFLVPEDAAFAGAIGAAVIAAEQPVPGTPQS
jgi:benzoyl-CoA reductase subunit D